MLAVLLVGTGAGGCGGGDGPPVDSADFAATFPLPFGLRQVDGTTPIGRPAIFDDVPVEYRKKPVPARTLKAAYRVVGNDPVATFRAWVDQVKVLHLGTVTVLQGDGPRERGAWLQAFGSGFGSDGPVGDQAFLQLWRTEEGPTILVDIARFTEGGQPTKIVDELGKPPRPGLVADNSDRTAGDKLFEEQGQVIHLPKGTRTLMSTLPVRAGSGGSASVLAAEDGPAAVRALLDEAVRGDKTRAGEVTGPDGADLDGAHIERAHFQIPAGGWGFDVVSIRAPADPAATVYVTSFAD